MSSDDLDEAANTYAEDFPVICFENDGGAIDNYDKPKSDFISGAQWQKEQIINKVYDCLNINFSNTE